MSSLAQGSPAIISGDHESPCLSLLKSLMADEISGGSSGDSLLAA